MLQIFIVTFILIVLIYAIPLVFRFIKTAWRMYRLKKARAAYFKCINDYFANLPPREPKPCKECKLSELSHNNGNLLCLNDRSRYFGMAVDPDGDKNQMCFEQKEQ